MRYEVNGSHFIEVKQRAEKIGQSWNGVFRRGFVIGIKCRIPS
jgi:hypothetical protein